MCEITAVIVSVYVKNVHENVDTHLWCGFKENIRQLGKILYTAIDHFKNV
jgi:hypothetical protein